MPSALPFDDFRAIARRLPGPAPVPQDFGGGAGRGARILRWLAEWSGRAAQPSRPLVALFVGTHGLAERASPGGPERMRALVERIAAGGTAVSGACARAGLGLKIFDLALDLPTADIAREPALDERACAATMAFGMEAVAGGTDLLVLSATGEGGGTAAQALLAAVPGVPPERQTAEIGQALALHGAAARDPLEALRRLGGRETAALAGAILAARTEKVPVLLDGLPALAAAAAVRALAPRGIDHCMVADCGGIQPAILERLELDHVLDLGLGEEDGTAGAIAAGLVTAIAGAAFSG